jgi:hypothetical protein
LWFGQQQGPHPFEDGLLDDRYVLQAVGYRPTVRGGLKVPLPVIQSLQGVEQPLPAGGQVLD